MAAKTSDEPYGIDDWWPNRLDLRVLKENAPAGDPMDADFDYAKEFSKLDLKAVKADITKTLTDSKEWWPADWGHYGGLMIRLAWHSAGTYRVTDGRGGSGSGTIRFAPLNSWPDNGNLDKARRLLWPVKKKYGRSLSWADLMILTGNVSLESMGFKTFGFGGGREDVYEPTDINWGPETEWLADGRFKDGKLQENLGATMMGLIYVNPEGPNGKPDPMASAQRIRTAFARMAMNDEETVALIAGGHTLGKAHGAAPGKHLGPEPEAAPVEQMGLGWKNAHGTGKGADTITSGLEGAWTYSPIKWSHDYFEILHENEWELTKSPAGAKQWSPKNPSQMVADAHDPKKMHKTMMLTTDLALITDPEYKKISKRFLDDPKAFEAAFARAWFKLTHRDLGPHVRLLGSEVPPPQIWQDPVPAVDHKLVNARDVAGLKKQILEAGFTTGQLVRTAWASASTYRDTDKRGGANGARVRLAPQKDWAANNPAELAKVIAGLEKIQKAFNKKKPGGRKISLADTIVLAGVAAVEDAAKRAGQPVKVAFEPGRTDATDEMTDAASFDVLEPKADGFRNYFAAGNEKNPGEELVEKADLLKLTAPEMTVLLGGMRALDANYDGSKHGILTDKPGTLSNDFFVNLLDMSVEWSKKGDVYEAKDRQSGKVKWTATGADLVIGSNSQLRAIAEVYAGDDAKQKFASDFAKVWHKVMMLDRFELDARKPVVLTQR
ncbi:MAG: catalase/peroxidase HPI [Deltaproteobacteria bacterium]